jgi:3-oxoacyl-[acyl-carrier-protein] synthase II
VYWGTGLGGATSIEESYHKLFAGDGRVRPSAVVLGMNNAAAAHISIQHELRGPILNVSTACSSSATAIGEAFRAIRNGDAEVIVAGGSEALVTLGNLRAWDAMQALAHADPNDPARSCKPFAADRTGIVLGEGAAALVLESAERASRRGAHVHAELAGYGCAADARGISQPDASGQVRAINGALAAARLNASEVDYLNAHGTGTSVGDRVETDAVRAAFGCSAARLPISSTKALHGHLMGAGGAAELIAAISAMLQGIVPPTAHLDHPDPACDLDYVANTAREAPLDVVMSNSFGFGGMNAVLVARRHTSAGYQIDA